MEREGFFTGYCRQSDGARTVCAVAEGKELVEADCLFEDCAYAADCPVGKSIREFLDKEN